LCPSVVARHRRLGVPPAVPARPGPRRTSRPSWTTWRPGCSPCCRTTCGSTPGTGTTPPSARSAPTSASGASAGGDLTDCTTGAACSYRRPAVCCEQYDGTLIAEELRPVRRQASDGLSLRGASRRVAGRGLRSVQ
jgi:hypothetical protein